MSKKSKASENIRVVIRSRDLLEPELQRGDKQAVRLDLATQQVTVMKEAGEPHQFAFDAVYNNTFKQRDIFLQEVQPLLESVLQGYNATVFAYGQSGSGKTHTMTGNLADRAMWGMMPQAVDHLFQEIKKLSSATRSFKVKVSYIELYNGKSRDLLATKQVNLEIKENMAKNFFVKGAETPEVTSFDECLGYFQSGTDRRQTASTNLNDSSSRSHSLFSLTIDQMDYEHDPSSPVVMTSKINIVDLAGSEKLGKTGATGDTAVEGNNINLSLTALATVIDTIVKGGKHIPYRGNSLTMLLKDSLGGNAKTVMFANLGPSDRNAMESVSTLRFAMRAKQIKNKPIKNLDPKDAHIQELLDKIEQLQRKLGDGYNPDEEENLSRRIEELEIENSELRGTHSNDNEGLADRVEVLQADVDKINKVVAEKDRELENAANSKIMVENNLKSEVAYSGELKSVCANFLRRVLTPEQLVELRGKMPQDGDYNLTDEGWELREIQFYMEGFLDLYESWRSTSFTEEDIKKQAERAVADAKDNFQRELDEANFKSEELERQQQLANAKRSADGEAHSQMKVELAALKEENTKLREKIERDQEKMKKKLEKMKEENRTSVDELDATNGKFEAAQRDMEKLKKLLEESGTRVTMNSGGGVASLGGTFSGSGGSGGAGGTGGPWSDEKQHLLAKLEEVTDARNKLESRLKETYVTMRRKGFCLKDNSSLLPGSSDVPPPPPGEDGGAHNDAFILAPFDDDEPMDNDVLGVLQQQIRVQHRLHELRHQHQKRLDEMVRKFELLKTGKATSNSGESGVSDETVRAKILEAVAEKDAEMNNLRAEHEKISEKLVKELNKKQSEVKDLKSTISDERGSLEEERAELVAQNDELQKFSQQLAIEVENLRSQLKDAHNDTDGAMRGKDAEVSHLKNDIAKLLATIEEYKTKAAAFEELQSEHVRLQQQNGRTEGAMKEKMLQLDNNRQMVKWSNSQLEEEKRRAHDLEEQIKSQDLQYKEMEEGWRQQLVENANKLVAINNRRLEEQAEEYQLLLNAENDKQKHIQTKLRTAKAQTAKAAQRYDEMVLENEALQSQLEEVKVSAMKIYKEKQEAQRDLDNFGSKGRGQRGL